MKDNRFYGLVILIPSFHMYGLDRLQHINQHLPSKTDFLRIVEEKISSVAKKKVLAMTIKLMNGRDNRKPPGGPGLQISTITQKFNLALWEHRKVRPAQRLRDVTKCENLRILGIMKMLFCAVQQVTANLKETLLVRTAQCSWLVHKFNVFKFSASLSDLWQPLLDFLFYTDYI